MQTKQQDNQNKPQKHREPNKSFHQYMKKDQNLPKKTFIAIIVQENPFQITPTTLDNNHPEKQILEDDHQPQRNSQNFSKKSYSRSYSRNSQNQNNNTRLNSNQHRFNDRSLSNSRNRIHSNNRSRNSSYNRYRSFSNDRNRNYSNNRNPRYQNNRSRDYSKNRSKYNNYHKRSRNNSQNRNSCYNNRQRSYSQSPERNNTRYVNSLQSYRSNTPKHQRQINQAQPTEETQPEPPGIHNNKTTELQLININCEFTDRESCTENTISINMINVENDNEPIIYEKPIYSQVYQNHDQFLLNYYTRPVTNSTTKQKIEKVVEEIKEEKPTECSSTINNHQNIPKETHLQKEKIRTIPLLLESPKSKQVQTPYLEINFSIDFLIDLWIKIKYYKPSHLE